MVFSYTPIDGEAVAGWFTEDFTLGELKRLRARERIPDLRPGNTRFDGMFGVPTFEEALTPAKRPYAPPARAWRITTAQFRALLKPRDPADIDGIN